MTYTRNELRECGVDELVIKVRSMRRKLRLTIDECAGMLGWHKDTLQRLELGAKQPSHKQRIQLQALYNRWHRVAARFKDHKHP